MLKRILDSKIIYLRDLVQALRTFLSKSPGFHLFPFSKNFHVIFLLLVCTVAVYINTLGHEMAFDDEQVIKKNEFVLRGIKGIPDILTHDSHYSFYKQAGLEDILPGGRYRPLSQITFAIEQELTGTWHPNAPRQFIWDVNGNGNADPDEDTIKDYVLNENDFFARANGLRHFVNVFLYAVCVLLLYVFLMHFLPLINRDVVFLSVVLFSLHPLHSEVVANIKSRDEILSLIFIVLTFIFAFRYSKTRSVFDLTFFTLSSLLALLSKEYALLLLPIILLVKYIHDSFLNKKVLFPLVFTYLLALSVYLLLRFSAVTSTGNSELFRNNLISNPYLLATPVQEIASKFMVVFKYFQLFVYPSALSCDYSYNSIPYSDFGSVGSLAGVVIAFSLLVLSIYFVIRKNILGIPFLIIVLFFVPVSNFFIDIGAVMGERLFFHASLGVCLLLTWPIGKISKIERFQNGFFLILFRSVMVLILACYGFLTFTRNKDWHNNESLFSADVKKYSENIVLLAGQADNYYRVAVDCADFEMKKSIVNKSIELIDRGLQINAAYMSFLQTLALDYYIIDEKEKSASACRAGLKIDPGNKLLNEVIKTISSEYVKKGIESFRQKNDQKSMEFFLKAIQANPNNSDALYNKAYLLKKQGDTLNAVIILESALKIEKRKEFYKLLDELKRKN